MSFSHKPSTGFHQKNKPFKSKFRTKGALHRKSGKLSSLTSSSGGAQSSTTSRTSTSSSRPNLKSPRGLFDQSKQERKNKAKQVAQAKRRSIMENKRLKYHGALPPRLVACIGLSSKISMREIEDRIAEVVTPAGPARTGDYIGASTVFVPRWKSRLQFFVVKERDLISIMDIAKVADIILFAVDPEEVCDEMGFKIISVIKSQGLLTSFGVVRGLSAIANVKKRKLQKRIVSDFFNNEFMSKCRLLTLDNQNDAEQLIRFICETKVTQLSWREIRPYMIVDKIDWKSNQTEDPSSALEFGTLVVSGYLRGSQLNPNNVIHITGYGDALISKIEGGLDPYEMKHKNLSKTNTPNEITSASLLAEPDENQETLTRENAPDPFAGEQTWPTQEEIELAIKNSMESKKRVPMGYSAYQAAWIQEDEEETVEGEDEPIDWGDQEVRPENPDNIEMTQSKDVPQSTQEKDTQITEPQYTKDKAKNPQTSQSKDPQTSHVNNTQSANIKPSRSGIATPNIKLSRSGIATPNDISLDEFEDDDEDEVEKPPKKNINEEDDEDVLWPDEVELEPNELARIRYQKYRGLKSFRTSPWDPKENLPREYSRIFQFQNFIRTYKRVLKENRAGSTVDPDQYVTIHLKNIHAKQFEKHPRNHRPLIVSGLLKYENKFSVINFKVTKHLNYTLPVKSKDPLEFHAGFRRWKAHPIFSENTLFSKFKYLRFFRGTVVATIYGPVCFPPTPLILLDQPKPQPPNPDQTEMENNSGEPISVNPPVQPDNNNDEPFIPKLVANGNLHSVNPDRIVLKKIVLTGHPAKIRGYKAIIRHMFYNPEDVKWFKPVELWTKYGRSGNIIDSVATKGRFKGRFDSHLQNHDTICMSLYKRIYPKWTSLPELEALWKPAQEDMGENEEEGENFPTAEQDVEEDEENEI